MATEVVLRYCGSCMIPKALDEFTVDRSKDDGLSIRCRPCSRAGAKLARLQGPRVLPPRGDPAGRERHTRAQRHRRHALIASPAEYRKLAIKVLGSRCAWCSALDDLQFDHVDGGGNLHRQTETHKALYKRIARYGIPADVRIQLLCPACHKAKSALSLSLRALAARGVNVDLAVNESRRALP